MSKSWKQIKRELSEPFPADQINWRVGATDKEKTKGIALAYLDARNVMDRLDTVMGENWQCEYPFSDGDLLICRIGLKVNGEWLWRSNGAGDTQVEAEKGKASDAFKRAAVLWGVGQYLYSLPNVWTPIVKAGNSWRIKDTSKLILPSWALPPVITISKALDYINNAKTREELDERKNNIADKVYGHLHFTESKEFDLAIEKKAHDLEAA